MGTRQLCAVAVCAGFLGCVPAKTDPVLVRKIVDRQREALLAAVENKDDVSIAELYAPDAQLFPPNGPAVAGRDTIRRYWKEHLRYMTRISLETVSLEVSMDLAYESGRYTAILNLPEGETYADTGKYLVVWKRLPHGAWLNAAAMWNSNLPRR